MSYAARAHVWVTGQVQGVFFRAFTERAAARHEVRGWVRNLRDGRVEAVFEGDPEAVEAVVAWCRDGSPQSTVTDVSVDWDEEPEGLQGFTVRR